MKMINMQCPNCKQTIQINDQLKKYMCPFCGANIDTTQKRSYELKLGQQSYYQDTMLNDFDPNEIDENASDLELLEQFDMQFRHTKQYYDTYSKNKLQIEQLLNQKSRIIYWAITIAFLFSGVLTIVGIFMAIVLLCTGKSYTEKKVAKIKAENDAIIDIIREDYLNTNMFLTFEYASPYIVEKLIKYFRNRRCDSIKEALNTYEIELNNYKQQLALARIEKKLNMISAATDYMAFTTFIDHI